MRNVLITGISRGLGLKLTKALLLDTENYVIGCSRTCPPEVCKLICDYPGQLEWHQLDLLQTDKLEADITEIIDGRSIDAVVNNAAILYKSLLVKMELGGFKNMLEINLTASVVVSKVLISNFLRNRKKGKLLFFSSICAHKGFSGLSLIGATKGAIESLSKNISYEYGRKGIRSNVISIGILDTGMSDTVNESQYSSLIAQSNLNQCTDSTSVVELSKYLLSDLSESVTGQVFHVNCGIL